MPSQTACLHYHSLSRHSSSVTGKSVHLSQLPSISQRVARLLSTEAWSQTHPSGKPFCLGGRSDGMGARWGALWGREQQREERPNCGSRDGVLETFTVSDQNNPPPQPPPSFFPQPQLEVIGHSEAGMAQRCAGSIGKEGTGWLAFREIKNKDEKKSTRCFPKVR